MASPSQHASKADDSVHVESAPDNPDSSASDPKVVSGEAHVPDGWVPGTAGEKALNKSLNFKLDTCLLPFLALLYLFNGLDRGNVGNAQTQGFTDDIGVGADDLNLAVSLFFITFVLFQPVSSAVGRYVGPKHWIPFIMFMWGVLTIIQAFIKGKGALIAVRLLIELFEAGFYPTSVFYLSTFYPRFDLAVRIGLFYGQYAIAGAFSGALAYGIFQLHGPLHNWQYLFIIEGAATCFVAILAWIWLPMGPGSAFFLTARQRDFAASRMQIDSARYVQHFYDENGLETTSERMTKRDVKEALKDWKLWYIIPFNICASVPAQAFSVFLPLVVKGLGYESIQANLMSVPPYVCGAAGLYLFAWSSDRRKERGSHILIGLVISVIGLIITVTTTAHKAKYAGLCILLFGSYVSSPLTVAWLSGNTPEPGKRSLVLGINGFGNLSGIIGSELFRANYAPKYRLPFYVTLGFLALSIIGYVSYILLLQGVNTWRRSQIKNWTETEIEDERTSELRYGDRKRIFQYGL